MPAVHQRHRRTDRRTTYASTIRTSRGIVSVSSKFKVPFERILVHFGVKNNTLHGTKHIAPILYSPINGNGRSICITVFALI